MIAQEGGVDAGAFAQGDAAMFFLARQQAGAVIAVAREAGVEAGLLHDAVQRVIHKRVETAADRRT